MIRLVIADDHPVVQEGFQSIIKAQPDMTVVGMAKDGEELLDVLESAETDVITLDISMPGPGFAAIMDELGDRWPDTAVLVVSMHAEESWALRALRAGAAGYLPKSRSAEELSEAIRSVHAGGRYVPPSVGALLAAEAFDLSDAPPHQALTAREYEVFQKLASGVMLKNAARELGLSPKTVSTHRRRILDKLGLNSTAELVRYAVERDLV